jgi:hypothetical protein
MPCSCTPHPHTAVCSQLCVYIYICIMYIIYITYSILPIIHITHTHAHRTHRQKRVAIQKTRLEIPLSDILECQRHHHFTQLHVIGGRLLRIFTPHIPPLLSSPPPPPPPPVTVSLAGTSKAEASERKGQVVREAGDGSKSLLSRRPASACMLVYDYYMLNE